MLWIWIFEVFATFTNDIKVLTGMKYLFLVLSQEYRDHLVTICKSFCPILVIEVNRYVFLAAALVFSNNEFFERVLQHPLKYPFSKYLKIWLRTFLQEEFK
jgi:hypothetical protein